MTKPLKALSWRTESSGATPRLSPGYSGEEEEEADGPRSRPQPRRTPVAGNSPQNNDATVQKIRNHIRGDDRNSSLLIHTRRTSDRRARAVVAAFTRGILLATAHGLHVKAATEPVVHAVIPRRPFSFEPPATSASPFPARPHVAIHRFAPPHQPESAKQSVRPRLASSARPRTSVRLRDPSSVHPRRRATPEPLLSSLPQIRTVTSTSGPNQHSCSKPEQPTRFPANPSPEPRAWPRSVELAPLSTSFSPGKLQTETHSPKMGPVQEPVHSTSPPDFPIFISNPSE
ncbi:hypothetical protein STAS_10027, partial [Striga asiatica]